jgi:methyltransferase (TIGR00027 family)
VGVPIDLRQDWPAALQQTGFDPSVPTAWSAEGLLPYLPAEAQDLLFERIQGLSAPGTRIAVEAFTNDFYSAEALARREAQMARYRAAAVKLGREDMTDTAALLYEEQRTEVVDWLRAHGWATTAVTAEELMAGNGRSVPSDLDDGTPQSVFVEGRLG